MQALFSKSCFQKQTHKYMKALSSELDPHQVEMNTAYLELKQDPLELRDFRGDEKRYLELLHRYTRSQR